MFLLNVFLVQYTVSNWLWTFTKSDDVRGHAYDGMYYSAHLLPAVNNGDVHTVPLIAVSPKNIVLSNTQVWLFIKQSWKTVGLSLGLLFSIDIHSSVLTKGFFNRGNETYFGLVGCEMNDSKYCNLFFFEFIPHKKAHQIKAPFTVDSVSGTKTDMCYVRLYTSAALWPGTRWSQRYGCRERKWLWPHFRYPDRGNKYCPRSSRSKTTWRTHSKSYMFC